MNVCACVSVCACVPVCLCACVCERESDRSNDLDLDRSLDHAQLLLSFVLYPPPSPATVCVQVCKSASLQVRESINPSIYLSYTFCSLRFCSTRDIPTQLDRESRNELVSLCAPSAVCVSLSVGE